MQRKIVSNSENSIEPKYLHNFKRILTCSQNISAKDKSQQNFH